MFDIKKEINSNKLLPGDKEYTDFKRGFNRGIDIALEVLSEYNLITTPKKVKLSEIINRLNKIDKSNKFKAIIKVSDTVVVENTEFKKEYFYVKDNKIFDLSTYMVKAEYKWLFNLWTTNTEILDDIGEILND